VKLGAMLGDVLRSLFRRPATEKYPYERSAVPARLRGPLRWNPEKCTGCCLCAKDCPGDALELIVLDKAQKRFVLRYHVDRCAFCAQCVQNCRFGCLEMPPEHWELAALTKEPFTVYYGESDDVQSALARIAARKSDPPPAK
jgi:formate hydrogenlyase subunit 6/NADH:ubiquinone oxidoreductase subunit I